MYVIYSTDFGKFLANNSLQDFSLGFFSVRNFLGEELSCQGIVLTRNCLVEELFVRNRPAINCLCEELSGYHRELFMEYFNGFSNK